MEKAERLNLLFSQDESLLELDTQLRTVLEIQPKSEVPHIGDSANTGWGHLDSTIPRPDQRLKWSSEPDTMDKPPCNATEAVSESPESAAQTIPAHNTPLPSVESHRSHDGSFSPLLTISRYAYKFVKGELSQRLANQFFDGGKFWNRCWDLHYIKLPPQIGLCHLILVPTSQVRDFFQEINHALQCNLALSDEGLILNFHKEGFPQPIFIGRSTSRETKDRLESQVPASSGRTCPSSGMDEQFLAFEQMIETAWETTRNRKKPSKAKQQLRIQNQQRLADSLRRTQSYLGLRSDEINDMIDDMSWEERRDQQPKPRPSRPLRMDKPVPFPFWHQPVFISIDVESNEHHHKQITEVGISTLDTLDLVDISPGDDGDHWRTKIQSRHLRVEEYAHHVNRDFVIGCPDNFDFGASEWVSTDDLVAAVQASFQVPTVGESHAPRNLVLVGHATTGDVRYLRQIGVRMERKPEGTAGFIDTVDTADFFRIIRNETTTRKLGGILQEFDMIGWHLHNAGNDARYTMEVMVQMMLEHSR
ncbi:hypothetical protein ETB97_004320 [Aspergillus alliaceus]|uniref:Uncharacterized protein n=1 Tax=Petromyces alliaceus TaxID=209559 RepID=A0A5N6FRX3_PETAA|nr:uncharacterized protein BDW43DRAFT_311824 [Aspergillus alliaceus]KAB8232751.1 hypothetical protein BDW43DRAFT_311824 [Aspergillus alliaceus]KAF5858524.1 hypothetical protein ETB97_004320 [Aspergillus burnettii]